MELFDCFMLMIQMCQISEIISTITSNYVELYTMHVNAEDFLNFDSAYTCYGVPLHDRTGSQSFECHQKALSILITRLLL